MDLEYLCTSCALYTVHCTVNWFDYSLYVVHPLLFERQFSIAILFYQHILYVYTYIEQFMYLLLSLFCTQCLKLGNLEDEDKVLHLHFDEKINIIVCSSGLFYLQCFRNKDSFTV